MDLLSNVLNRFSLQAQVFFSGNLCGVQAFEEPHCDHGHLHLLREGRLVIKDDQGQQQVLDQPGVIYFPRPTRHRLFADESAGVDLVCARIHYQNTVNHPLTQSLPMVLHYPLSDSGLMGQVALWLFDEAFSDHSGRQPVVDRLCDIFLIHVLRQALAQGDAKQGMMAGLAHPQLARLLVQLHQHPESPWNLESMADQCGMSRSKFAEVFKKTVGQSPGDYLLEWRISVAQKLLLQDQSMDLIANQVGYETGSALARAFRKKLGLAPTQWLADHQQLIK